MPSSNQEAENKIKPLDHGSVHRISSGQVVVDLQTAVKELVENSLDAGSTSIEARFKEHGVVSFEVVDNGSGIAPEDYDAIALKHHTSKLSSFSDLDSVSTFGFRGEALSSLCALAESVTVTTATAAEAPMGTVLEFDSAGRLVNRKGKVARQRGTTVIVSGLFKSLPVRRRELERNAKREFGKALALLSAYALIPCAQENKGVRLTVSHHTAGGKKSVQMRTDGTPSTRASISALWGPKTLENLIDLDIIFNVETERAVLRRRGIVDGDTHANEVRVRGQISKFAVGCGRGGTDRQFFFVNGRPCSPTKVQKAFNEVYRTFNANQAPFIVADFILPTDSMDVNVSPDKRTILLHSEKNLIEALKVALEAEFASSRATYDITPSGASQSAAKETTSRPPILDSRTPLFLGEDEVTARMSEPAAKTTPAPSSATNAQDDLPDAFGRPTLLVGNLVVGVQAVGVEPRDMTGPGARVREADGTAAPRASGPEEPMGPEARESTAEPSHSPASMSPRGGAAEPRVILDEEDAIPRAGPQADEEDLHQPTSVSMTQPAFADSGSPSASQALPLASQEAQSIDGPSPHASLTYDRDAKRCFTEQNSARSTVGASRSVQTVLSTQGASWSLRQHGDDIVSESGVPIKRRKTDNSGPGREGAAARQVLRSTLRNFARPGSQIVDETVDEDESEDVSMHETHDASLDEDGAPDIDMDRRSSSLELPQTAKSPTPAEFGQSPLPSEAHAEAENVIDLPDIEGGGVLSCADPRGDATPNVSTISGTSTGVSRPEVIRTAEEDEADLGCDLPRITQAWHRLEHNGPTSRGDVLESTSRGAHEAIRDAGISNVEDDRATEALARVIDKSDFRSMDIVGQFNLGFIIGRRRKLDTPSSTDPASRGTLDDLFIIDQHAADEKFNFETLQETTKIESQRLFQPQPLELSAADALLAVENIDILRRNGFEMEVHEDSMPGEGHRLCLVAQPTSKSTVFDMQDLEELLQLMQDRPAGQMVRCSKARAMFAMRACRKSVMIGMPLNRQQMISVVRHMGTMDQPWHCPHGRPTMRHLSDISGTGRDWREQRSAEVDWTNFGSLPPN